MAEVRSTSSYSNLACCKTLKQSTWLWQCSSLYQIAAMKGGNRVQGLGICHLDHCTIICCSSLCSRCWACVTTSKFTSRQNSCFLSPSLSLAVSLTVYGPYSSFMPSSVSQVSRGCLVRNCIAVPQACGTATMHHVMPTEGHIAVQACKLILFTALTALLCSQGKCPA